jgi:hypothetical protein
MIQRRTCMNTVMNFPSFLKGREVIDKLSNYKLLNIVLLFLLLLVGWEWVHFIIIIIIIIISGVRQSTWYCGH